MSYNTNKTKSLPQRIIQPHTPRAEHVFGNKLLRRICGLKYEISCLQSYIIRNSVVYICQFIMFG